MQGRTEMHATVESRPVQILIADDDPIVRQVVRAVLGENAGCVVLGEAEDGRQACDMVAQHAPDILLLDLLMPHLPGLETLRQLTAGATGAHTILLCSAISNRQVLEALQLGARGVVLKHDVAELLPAIEAVMAGKYWIRGKSVSNVVQVVDDLMRAGKESAAANRFRLTARELQIIALITQGYTNRDLGQALRITEETVKRHLTNIYNKVGMSNRLELALFAIEHSLARK